MRDQSPGTCEINVGTLALMEGDLHEAQRAFASSAEIYKSSMENSTAGFWDKFMYALSLLASGRGDDALVVYRQAMQICSAKGVIETVLMDLDLLKRTGIAGAPLMEARQLLLGEHDNSLRRECLSIDRGSQSFHPD